MVGDQPRISSVRGGAVARHDHADDITWRRHLAEPRDDGGIDSSAQPDRESLGAADRQVLAQPFWNLSGIVAHGDLSWPLGVNTPSRRPIRGLAPRTRNRKSRCGYGTGI